MAVNPYFPFSRIFRLKLRDYKALKLWLAATLIEGVDYCEKSIETDYCALHAEFLFRDRTGLNATSTFAYLYLG